MVEQMTKDTVECSHFCTDENWREKNCRILNHEDNLKRISEYYQLMRELRDELNLVFGYSNPLTILFSFGLIMTEVNWVYWRLYNKVDIMNMIG